MMVLDVHEARAILIADDALDATFDARQLSGELMGLEEGDAWRALVLRAKRCVELAAVKAARKS